MHLIQAISAASASFFQALGSLQHLQQETSHCVSNLKSLRSDLNLLDRQMSLNELDILILNRQRSNMLKLEDTLAQIFSIFDGLSHCVSLVQTSQFDAALDKLDILQNFITGQLPSDQNITWLTHYPRRTIYDLSSLSALRSVFGLIKRLHESISLGFENTFLQFLLNDCRNHCTNTSPAVTLSRWVLAAQKVKPRNDQSHRLETCSYLVIGNDFRHQVVSFFQTLTKLGHIVHAANSVRGLILREMKLAIRRNLPSFENDSLSTNSHVQDVKLSESPLKKSLALSRSIQALTPQEMETLLVKIYTRVGESLRRFNVQIKVILDITTSFVASPRQSEDTPHQLYNFPKSSDQFHRETSLPREELLEILDLTSLMEQAVDIILSHVSEILKLRTEQATNAPINCFLRYVTLNRLFAQECEAVSGRSCNSLKSVVNGHIREFIVNFRDMEKASLRKVMDADRWQVVDLYSIDTQILSRLLDQSLYDNKFLEKYVNVAELEDNHSATDTVTDTPKVSQSRYAEILGERYFMVTSSVHVLHTLDRFFTLLAVIPTINEEVGNAIVEYITAFNGRSFELILKAEAVKLASLSNINTKHMALLLQTLRFFIALIPFLSKATCKKGNEPSKVTGKFDDLIVLLTNHQLSIRQKLVEIMGFRSGLHIKSMKQVNYDDPDAGSERISPHMEAIIKETCTLHRVLNKHLPRTDVKQIMLAVSVNYREIWEKAFDELTVKTALAKERLLREAEYFHKNVNEIDGFEDAGQAYLTQVISKKFIDTSE